MRRLICITLAALAVVSLAACSSSHSKTSSSKHVAMSVKVHKPAAVTRPTVTAKVDNGAPVTLHYQTVSAHGFTARFPLAGSANGLTGQLILMSTNSPTTDALINNTTQRNYYSYLYDVGGHFCDSYKSSFCAEHASSCYVGVDVYYVLNTVSEIGYATELYGPKHPATLNGIKGYSFDGSPGQYDEASSFLIQRGNVLYSVENGCGPIGDAFAKSFHFTSKATA